MRLIDELPGRVRAIAPSLEFEVVEFRVFGDTIWPPVPRLEAMLANPAFALMTATRWVVFQPIASELRYYAAALPPGTDVTGTRPGPSDPAYELGIVDTMDDALQLASQYLSGDPLSEVVASRRPPPFAR
jgi:hypothetical protein